MCYKCEVCENSTPPGQARLFIPVYRSLTWKHTRIDEQTGRSFTEEVCRKEIEREIQLCPSCHFFVTSGMPLRDLSVTKGRAMVVGLKDDVRKKKPPFKQDDYVEESSNGCRPCRGK